MTYRTSWLPEQTPHADGPSGQEGFQPPVTPSRAAGRRTPPPQFIREWLIHGLVSNNSIRNKQEMIGESCLLPNCFLFFCFCTEFFSLQTKSVTGWRFFPLYRSVRLIVGFILLFQTSFGSVIQLCMKRWSTTRVVPLASATCIDIDKRIAEIQHCFR